MMRALEPEVHDAVFEAIKGLLPQAPPHPLGCHRPRIPDRVCFDGLLIRIVTGAAWETIEFLMSHQVSDTTLRARRDEWIAAGVFDRLVEEARHAYDHIIGLDTSHVAIDGSDHAAPCGGQATGAGPKQHGRKGWKWCSGVDAEGIPLGWTTAGANRQDYALLEDTLDDIITNLATPHAPTPQLGTLHLDRGFGYKSLPTKTGRYPIDNINVIARRDPGQGRIQLVGFGRRWVAERTHSWLTNYGQLRHNTDRTTRHRHAALCLATTLLITARLIDHRNQHHRPIR